MLRRGGLLLRWASDAGRRLEAPVALLATAALLAACQVPQSSLHATRSSVAQTQTQSQPPASPAPIAPRQTPLAATPAVAHGVEDASSSIAPMQHFSGDPKELVGLDHTVVRRALGEPTRIRNELPAQVWQYATGDCVVDLYLYDQDGAWTVTYVEARSHTAESAPTSRCLKSLLERPTASAD